MLTTDIEDGPRGPSSSHSLASETAHGARNSHDPCELTLALHGRSTHCFEEVRSFPAFHKIGAPAFHSAATAGLLSVARLGRIA